MLFGFARALGKPVAHCLYKLKFEGVENIPATGRVILASNHLNAVDPGLIAVGTKRTFAVMAKQELFDKRFTAFLLARLGAFPTKRNVADMSAIDYAVNVLRSERALLIFPEGTRCPDDPLKRLKSGVIAISAMSQSPIIPVAVIAPEGYKLRAPITIRFGKKIDYWELGVTEFKPKQYRAAKELLLSRMRELYYG